MIHDQLIISFFFLFFFLAVWIILLTDIFIFTRKTVSHAQQGDAQIWVTMQINSKTDIKILVLWNCTWILQMPRILLVSFDCFSHYLLPTCCKTFSPHFMVYLNRWIDLIAVQMALQPLCLFLFCSNTNAQLCALQYKKDVRLYSQLEVMEVFSGLHCKVHGEGMIGKVQQL